MNYEDDIKIDETALDVEWLEQPRLMFKYARHCAKMEMEKDLAKERLDVIRAGLDQAIRKSPLSYKISEDQKVTETLISNTILQQEEFVEANAEYLEALHEFKVAKAVVDAIQQRKDALENLVRLHGLQYFAGPRIPRNLTEERVVKEKIVNKGISAKISRK